MPEIEKCALCGYSPMHLIRDGIDKISCCGLMCDALRWNHVQRSISSEKELLVQVKALEEALTEIGQMAQRYKVRSWIDVRTIVYRALEVTCQNSK